MKMKTLPADTTNISFNINNETLLRVENISKELGLNNRTSAINMLLLEALNSRNKKAPRK
jgi:metal-responsive CopG/Arc/MetJ family transcriptional regulator